MRNIFVQLLLQTIIFVFSKEATSSNDNNIKWIDAKPFIFGKAFNDTKSYYDRLPSDREGVVTDAVWSLSRDSAGMYASFETNTTTMSLNVTYLNEDCEMYHFPTTGVCGMDLYAKDETSSKWRWVSTTRNNKYPYSLNSMTVVSSTSSSMIKYKLHLPTYNGVVNLQIGINENSVITKYDDKKSKKVLWYGTSITQGGVASRPGQIFTNIISRNLEDVRVYNFGFSGNGLMSLHVADALVRVPDVSLFVIDCSWNMNASLIESNTIPLIRYLRTQYVKNDVPIVLAEDTTAGAAWVDTNLSQEQEDKRHALRSSFETLNQEFENIYYVSRDSLFNFTQFGYEKPVLNPTAAGCHPTDLGMYAVANFYTDMIPKILSSSCSSSKSCSRLPVTRSNSNIIIIENNTQTQEDTTQWVNVSKSEIPVIGRAFTNETFDENYFYRFPTNAKDDLREEVWNLSKFNTGMGVAFTTNSPSISIEYVLENNATGLWHMCPLGTSGLDLFRYDFDTKMYRFVGSTSMTMPHREMTTTVLLASGMRTDNQTQKYWLNLPMRNSLKSLRLGVPNSYDLPKHNDIDFNRDGVTFNKNKPIVWYGTSIVQGGAVSRPGSTFTNILSRELERLVLNFGFAGNGRMELGVAKWIVTIDAALFVIDCLPNLNAELVTERTSPLVRFLRNHTNAPILLVAGPNYGDYWISNSSNVSKRKALKEQYESLLSEGIQDLYFFENGSDELYFRDPYVNPTVGGTHPSDLGHREIAVFYREYLKQFL